jgi:hypothetical protein
VAEFDLLIERLAAGVGHLPRAGRAAFFGLCGEGLFPLYRTFAAREGFGDPAALRDALDLVWQSRAERRTPPVGPLLQQLDRITPHADDFTALDCTFAQDAVVCVDAALRAVSPDEDVDPFWCEYALEPIKWSIQNELLSSADFEASNEDVVLAAIAVDPRWTQARSYCQAVVDFLAAHPDAELPTIVEIVGEPTVLQPARPA